MSLDVTMKSGETLRAEYNETCIRLSEQQQSAYDVTLKEQVFGYYMGPARKNKETNEYYIALTNTSWTGSGTSFAPTSEGYVMVLDFYGATGSEWKNMPTGSFTESALFTDHTFFSDNSGVVYIDSNNQRHPLPILDPVKIELDNAGIATVTATFLDKNSDERTIIYKGNLKISNATLNVHLPMIDHDVTDFEGAYAKGSYQGDVFDNGSGLVEITITNQAAENNGPNAYAATLVLFSEKFINPKLEMKLIPGTYTVSTRYEQQTWMPAVEAELMGMYFPMGTYLLYDDGTQIGQYSYAKSGTIVVREGSSKWNYTIEFDLQSLDGYTIRGSYTGYVDMTDTSADDHNDGTSNLTSDYDMDLSKQPRADCYQPEKIWIRGLDEITMEECYGHSDGRRYGFQQIQIGVSSGLWEFTDEYPLEMGRGKLIETDKVAFDLLVPEGTEDRITPGTYAITTNRYPKLFYAGYCVCGYNCYYGTSIQHITSALGWGFPTGYFDPTYKTAGGWLNVPRYDIYASIYAGTVTVEKAEGGDNWFTFKLEGKDVLKHNVTGSWTGPVYLGNSNTPVVQSEVGAKTTGRTAAKPTGRKATKPASPSYRTLRSTFLNLEPVQVTPLYVE